MNGRNSCQLAAIKIKGLSGDRCLSVKTSDRRSGRTAKAGTVSVGKLTKLPDFAPDIKVSRETKPTKLKTPKL
jgi:hypothetical protein